MNRRTVAAVAVLCAGIGCARDRQAERDRDRDIPAARRAGHAAYGAAQEGKEMAGKAAKELWKAGKEAHAGWKDAAREHKEEQADRRKR